MLIDKKISTAEDINNFFEEIAIELNVYDKFKQLNSKKVQLRRSISSLDLNKPNEINQVLGRQEFQRLKLNKKN